MVTGPSASLDLSAAVAPRKTVEFVRSIDSVRQFSKPKSFWGRALEFVAGPPEGGPRLLRPYGITQDSVGRIIVADPGQRVVHIFDPEKKSYHAIRKAGRDELASPIGVAVDADDNIYVTDSVLRRICVYDKKGRYRRTISTVGPGEEFKRPTGICIDRAARRIYLTDTLRHQVLVLALDGSLIQQIGRRGTGEGEFNFPTGLAIYRDTLYVVDAMNFRIQALSLNGRYLRSFGHLGGQTGTMNRPKGIAVDSDGNLFIVDALFETVQVFDPEGRVLYYFGASGTGPGQFTLPAGIYIDPRDRVWVADSYNRRIQEFRCRKVTP